MPRYMDKDKLKPLLIDGIYNLRTQQDIANLSGYSVQRISQLTNQLVRSATNAWSYRREAKIISAVVYRCDPRNRCWADTPEAFYNYERNLTQKEQ